MILTRLGFQSVIIDYQIVLVDVQNTCSGVGYPNFKSFSLILNAFSLIFDAFSLMVRTKIAAWLVTRSDDGSSGKRAVASEVTFRVHHNLGGDALRTDGCCDFCKCRVM